VNTKQSKTTTGRKVRPSITMAQRGVYHLLKHLGPATDAELVDLYPAARRLLDRGSRYPEQKPSGIRTRRSELVEKGYVVEHDRLNGRKLWRAV
jgi:hypothetical protein